MNTGKNIILGVTGSIAAHKAADLASLLTKGGCRVRVVMTADAQKFITPLPFKTLTRNPVVTDLYDEDEGWKPTHIEMADTADLLLIAPATANCIAKLALGLANDALSCIALALNPKARMLLAPAMNGKMWLHPATQQNVATLKARGGEFRGGGRDALVRLRGDWAVVAGGTDWRTSIGVVKPSGPEARRPRPMKWWLWSWLSRVPRLFEAPRPEPAQHARRILRLQRDVVLPAKFVVIIVVFYYLYRSPWVDEKGNTYGVVLETMRNFFGYYILLNLLMGVSFFVVRGFPAAMVQWVVFVIGLVDGLFLGGLTLMTGGFDSILYWVFPGLIVLNALCIPLATPQLVLNLTLSGFFLLAGILEPDFRNIEQAFPTMRPLRERKPIQPVTAEEIANARALVTQLWRTNNALSRIVWRRLHEPVRERLDQLMQDPGNAEQLQELLVEEFNRLFPNSRYVTQPSSELPDNPTEPFFLRLVILWLLTPCCYGVQVLGARQEEQKEFAARTAQLRSAGRQAAEFAHQIKNPLAIINNAAFSLQRAVRGHKGDPDQQVRIIQEEVEKADRIITQIMGYAELSEGRVETLEVREELERAIERVFPRGAQYGTEIRQDYAAFFPPLLMQRGHLSEIFANLLQNARDVLEGKGHITIAARCLADYAIEVSVADDGPGIPPDKFERVFEAYYTTRPKGTGLGLAIVKHNVELYGGTVRVESELGKGARFTVVFPASTAVKLSRPS